MKTIFKKYTPEYDFIRIRDFLVDTYSRINKPFNWTLERWNYARYFVVPMKSNISTWEDEIGIWENEEGKIVGVINSECEEPGEAFVQIDPQYSSIYTDMISYAEENIAVRENSVHRVKLYIYEDNIQLQEIAREQGYTKLADHPQHISEYIIRNLPEKKLPKNYKIETMADKNNIELHRKVMGRAFGHLDPSEWIPISLYKELQTALNRTPKVRMVR